MRLVKSEIRTIWGVHNDAVLLQTQFQSESKRYSSRMQIHI